MTSVTSSAHAGSVVVADDDLREKVRQALAWHFWIPRDRIRIEIEDSWVTLRGHVDWIFQKRAVEDALSQVEGIRGITNEISIEQQSPTRYYPHSSR